MIILKLDYIKEAMNGCVKNDYKMIRRAGQILLGLAEGYYDINIEDDMKRALKGILYKKFMRAYTRYVIANPNSIHSLSIDCCFASIIHGEYAGIVEP